MADARVRATATGESSSLISLRPLAALPVLAVDGALMISKMYVPAAEVVSASRVGDHSSRRDPAVKTKESGR